MNYPIRILYLTCLSILAWAWAGTHARADSLWAKASRQSRNLYTDDTARNVGDVLTVIIQERSSFDQETNRNNSKKSSVSASTAGTFDGRDMLLGKLRGTEAFRFPELSLNSSFDQKFDGKAGSDTARSVDDQITVAVEDVLPNGNLVVLGTRYREIDQEKQIVQISGIVRPSDIAFDNTIASRRVADFRLVLKIDGPENNYTKPGWFARIWEFVNPF